MSEQNDLVTFAVSVGLDVFDGNERMPPEIERARATCEQLLAKRLDLPDATIWKLLVSSAALIGEDDVAILVHELADGSASAECPRCDHAWKLVPAHVPATATLPPELSRLADRARSSGHASIAETLEALANPVECPSCRELSPALDTLDALR